MNAPGLFTNLEAKSRNLVDVNVRESSLPFVVDVYVVEHGHEDDSITELCRFDAGYLQVVLDGVRNLQSCESCEIFHSNSIGSPPTLPKAHRTNHSPLERSPLGLSIVQLTFRISKWSFHNLLVILNRLSISSNSGSCPGSSELS